MSHHKPGDEIADCNSFIKLKVKNVEDVKKGSVRFFQSEDLEEDKDHNYLIASKNSDIDSCTKLFEELIKVSHQCVPHILPVFEVKGSLYLLMIKRPGPNLKEFISLDKERLSFFVYRDNKPCRPSKLFQNILRSLVQGINAFQNSGYYPEFNHDRVHVIERSEVRMQFTKLTERRGGSAISDWKLFRDYMTHIKEQFTDQHQRKCLDVWMNSFMKLLQKPKGDMQKSLIDTPLFWSYDQRLEFMVRAIDYAKSGGVTFSFEKAQLKSIFNGWEKTVEGDLYLKALRTVSLHWKYFRNNLPLPVTNKPPSPDVMPCIVFIRDTFTHFIENKSFAENRLNVLIPFNNGDEFAAYLDSKWPHHLPVLYGMSDYC